eukprot:5001446-Prymnesium_polylepis.2
MVELQAVGSAATAGLAEAEAWRSDRHNQYNRSQGHRQRTQRRAHHHRTSRRRQTCTPQCRCRAVAD